MPGILAGLVGAVVSAAATKEDYGFRLLHATQFHRFLILRSLSDNCVLHIATVYTDNFLPVLHLTAPASS